VLVFGPITSTDVVRFRQNKGGGLSLPDKHQFEFQLPQAPWFLGKTVEVDGATYLHLRMRVTNVTEPCTGLQAWAQF
jgi:hypothetical protein